MKLRRRPLRLSIFLLCILSLTQAAAPIEHVQGLAEGKRGEIPPARPGPDPSLSTSLLVKPTSAVGTKDAPVDGKDGKPHEGPFVETAAQRDRKKAKESGEEEVPPSGKKPGPKESSKGASYTDGWNLPMPESNDGVMDDPHRLGPKEGTRGTEGGISEKSKDRKTQEEQSDAQPEKKPDSPKEAPPLPHSEQEKLAPADKKDASKTDKADATVGEERPKKLGGLEVTKCTTRSRHSCEDRLTSTTRNQLISPKSLMTYRTPSHLVHPKRTRLRSRNLLLLLTIFPLSNLPPLLSRYILTFSPLQ